MVRAAARYRLACELVGGMPESADGEPAVVPADAAPRPLLDLGFTPEEEPWEISSSVRRSFRVRFLVAVGLAVVMLASVILPVLIVLAIAR